VHYCTPIAESPFKTSLCHRRVGPARFRNLRIKTYVVIFVRGLTEPSQENTEVPSPENDFFRVSFCSRPSRQIISVRRRFMMLPTVVRQKAAIRETNPSQSPRESIACAKARRTNCLRSRPENRSSVRSTSPGHTKSLLDSRR
jgi:hypothetical protein